MHNSTFIHTHTHILIVCLVSLSFFVYQINNKPKNQHLTSIQLMGQLRELLLSFFLFQSNFEINKQTNNKLPLSSSTSPPFSFCLFPSHLILHNEKKKPKRNKTLKKKRNILCFFMKTTHTRLFDCFHSHSLSSLVVITRSHHIIGIICLSLSLSSFGIDRSIRSSFF